MPHRRDAFEISKPDGGFVVSRPSMLRAQIESREIAVRRRSFDGNATFCSVLVLRHTRAAETKIRFGRYN